MQWPNLALLVFCCVTLCYHSSAKITAQDYLAKYNFIETPSRGYFSFFFESPENTSALPTRYGVGQVRNYGSCKLHLMDFEHPTAVFHKVKATLIISFLRGYSTVFYLINQETGNLRKVKLGSDFDEEPIFVIPGDTWFAVSLFEIRKGRFGLLSSVAIPGTVRRDSVIASRQQLLEEYPQHRDVILYFTKSTP